MATYKSNYTGTQIDTAVGRALPDGELDKKFDTKINKPESNIDYITVPSVDTTGEQSKVLIGNSKNTGMKVLRNFLLSERVPYYTATNTIEYVKFRQMTEAEYNTTAHDRDTIYFIVG